MTAEVGQWVTAKITHSQHLLNDSRIEWVKGEKYKVVAVTPCPEEFYTDYADDDLDEDGNYPVQYIVWKKFGCPMMVCSTHFEVVE